MNPTDDPLDVVIAAISDVAPELEQELSELDRDTDLWQELQLDSMDHLSVMTRLAAATGLEIPERDYPTLLTLNAISHYVSTGNGAAS